MRTEFQEKNCLNQKTPNSELNISSDDDNIYIEFDCEIKRVSLTPVQSQNVALALLFKAEKLIKAKCKKQKE